MNIFLGNNWLVKYNPEVNQNTGTIQFIRYPKEYKTQQQDITFMSRTQRLQPTEDIDKEQQAMGKKLNLMNPEDLLKYIQPFTHFFNKKKFEKLLE